MIYLHLRDIPAKQGREFMFRTAKRTTPLPELQCHPIPPVSRVGEIDDRVYGARRLDGDERYQRYRRNAVVIWARSLACGEPSTA